ncbi:MAG: N-acetylneuraminate synthase [Lachnospiraceae bacterium]|nr:N-acetylneuraminate synthase [Lachnospiraceae bacterium]
MEKTYIIAEAGVNHNGSLKIAKDLIDEAVKAGADAIKFQMFTADTLVCKDAEKAKYQKVTTGKDETQYEMLKKLELSYEAHQKLKKYCEAKGIEFLSTPFDIKSAKLLNTLQIPIFKIPSGEITNLPYLREIASFHKEIILSTGMSTVSEIEEAISILKRYGAKKISVLHCTTQYPTPMEDVNLKAIMLLKDLLDIPVGYSDHTSGIEVSIAAVAIGASIIEKHFTLNREMEGPDHKASINPDELTQMIRSIRNIELALGDKMKCPSKSETDNIQVVRKSIVAAVKIGKDEIFSEDNITTKRPGTGISPMLWDSIIGKKANKDYEKDEMIIL